MKKISAKEKVAISKPWMKKKKKVPRTTPSPAFSKGKRWERWEGNSKGRRQGGGRKAGRGSARSRCRCTSR
jgi:hypothetical protein